MRNHKGNVNSMRAFFDLSGNRCIYELPNVMTFYCVPGGGSRIFLRRGASLFYFNTIKSHSFYFCRIPVILESCMSSQGGGRGWCAPPAPLDLPPRSVPVYVSLYFTLGSLTTTLLLLVNEHWEGN